MSGESVVNGMRKSVLVRNPQCVEVPSSSHENFEKTSESKRRKLHKTYIKGWNEGIARNGFARCIIASCNFTSTDIESMQNHHKTCFGTHYENNAAGESQLNSSNQVTQISQNNLDESFKIWESQIQTLGQAYCGNQDCNFAAMSLSDLENHTKSCVGVPDYNLFCCMHCRCGFSNKEDRIKHQQNCNISAKLGSNSKKLDTLHFRNIKQMKNKDASEEHIIQPGPDLPEGQYRRRRAYRAEHKNSWALTLEKYKYVKCIYQNCYFIAMSLEDMISHFGYCNGDGSFAKFVCPHCNGRVTSEAVLLKHIERSHTLEGVTIKEEPVNNEYDDISKPQEAGAILDPNDPNYKKIRRKHWEKQITESGNAFCGKSLCNFISPNLKLLEIHAKKCEGTPDFESCCCQKCGYRLPTEVHLTRHAAACNGERTTYYAAFGIEPPKSRNETPEDDDFEIRPVVRQYESKRPRNYSKKHKPNPSTPEPPENNSNDSTSEDPKQKARGRPKKPTETEETDQKEQVKCGKCDFKGTRNDFVFHNMKTHVGLGWIEGEQPVDMNDEKLVIRLVKEAFKLNKKGACEKCDDVKKSVMGFVTHIQNCGKSEAEKDALKIKCPHCEGKYLKYSLSSHIKFSHGGPEGEEEERTEVLVVEADPSGKRRSAIKAVSKFQQVLDENEEPESSTDTHYVLYERGNERTPKLNSKLNNLWYRLKRENKKIPCRHENCQNLSDDVREAKNHHYNCPLLPEKVYMCEICDYYSVDESNVKSHVTTHRKYLKQKKTKEEEEEVRPFEVFIKSEEEDVEEEDDVKEEENVRSSEEEPGDLDESRKRKKKKESDERNVKKARFSMESVKTDLDLESRLKQNFCRREKIDNVRGIQFYSNGLEMTLQEEVSELCWSDTWPELNTSREDWLKVPGEEALECFPQLGRSVSVRFSGDEKWRKFERFNGDLINGVPVMFTGGSVRSMSWCKISFRRMMEKTQKQYLAVTTARKLDHLKDIYDRSSVGKSTLLQIWDCGVLDNNAAREVPKFVLGMIQNGGEIWDMSWFPNDTHAERTEKRLARLGLLATASEDGAVRVWSICDPSQLENAKGPPVYMTDPVVILKPDEHIEESCLRLAVGADGVLAGGYGNGTVAVWNLRNISSPFCKKSGKCRIMRAHLVLHAHKTAITALSFCPTNTRYISTAGLDRFVKVWDLESPSIPVEQNNKDYSLDNIWTMNWPSIIYNFDDVVINYNKGAVKFIKSVITERHQSTFAMEDPCLSISFSDWLNAICGGSITGEVKLRLLKNLIHDQKRSQSTISSCRLEKLREEDGGNGNGEKDFPKSYEDAELRFGLVFRDNLGMDKGKPKKPEAHPEAFPVKAVNKLAFNPNFESFTHLAVGYNCGLVRVQQLKELQSAKSLKFFLDKTHRQKF